MSVKREFELSEEDAAFIDDRVKTGGGAPDDVVGAAIKMMRDKEAYIDRWIEEEVMPTHERWKAGLEKEYSVDEVFGRLEKRLRERFSKKAS